MISRSLSGRGAGRLLLVLLAFAPFAVPQAALAYEAKDCDQDEVASLSLRACSALLDTPDLSQEDRVRFLVSRGNAWIREEEPDQAILDFTRALEKDPANRPALLGRARAHTQLKHHEAAAADLSAVIGKAPSSPETESIYFDRAESLAAAGKSDAALADYDAILAATPGSVKARIGRARVFTALKDREKALAEFDAILAADAKESSAYLARAEAAETWGDTKSAIADYRKFIELNNRMGWSAVRALRRLGVER